VRAGCRAGPVGPVTCNARAGVFVSLSWPPERVDCARRRVRAISRPIIVSFDWNMDA